MPDRSRPLAAQKPLPSPAKRRATRTGGAPRAPPKAELREFVDSGPARKLMALQSSRDKKKALKKKNRSDELAARAHTVSATVVAPTPRLRQWLRPGGPQFGAPVESDAPRARQQKPFPSARGAPAHRRYAGPSDLLALAPRVARGASSESNASRLLCHLARRACAVSARRSSRVSVDRTSVE